MLTCSRCEPLGLSHLRKMPWSTQLSARKMGQRDIRPLCTHQRRPFLKCSQVVWVLTSPGTLNPAIAPQVSKHSCYPWLICHRRKQGTDWDTPWKHVERRAKRILTIHGSWASHCDDPKLYTCLYSFGLGGKNRKLKNVLRS